MPRVHPVDLMPQGDPETVVILPDSTLVGLLIRGVDGHTMLGIREDAHGYPISCAVGIVMETTDVPIQSNPHRTDEDLGED